MAVDQSASWIASNGPEGGPPVLVTRMSIPPSESAAVSDRRSASAWTPTSAAIGEHRRPGFGADLAAACSSASARRAQIATRAPSRASASADARPSPLLAAQTIAHLPLSRQIR